MTRFREVVERIRGVCAVLYSPVRTARIMEDHRLCDWRLNEARKDADQHQHREDMDWRLRCKDLERQLNDLKREGRDREAFISSVSSLYEQHLEDS